MKEDWTQLNVPARPPRPEESTRTLGQVLDYAFSRMLASRKDKAESVREAWEAIAPAGLKQHCRLRSFDRGQLTVAAGSPAFRYEFQLCRHALLEAIQQQYPRAGVKSIKCVLG